MEIQHFSHEHPLVFVEEWSHESDDQKAYCCSACGELMSGPSFSCVACGFHLDKKCAEAPSELNHPLHSKHNFNLLKRHPYRSSCSCDFCNKNCENFVYHCSCKVDLHIKCALLSYNIAKQKLGELQHISHIDPLISMEKCTEELKEAKCLACWKSLLNSTYLSLDSGFFLHRKCVELPIEINHLFHRQHSLSLQFNSERLPCQICQDTQRKGFVYCCSSCKFPIHIACVELPTKINHPCHRKHPLTLELNLESSFPCQFCEEITQGHQGVYCCSTCKFAIHIKCAFPTPIVEDMKSHEHPFSRCFSPFSFICDACGTLGNYVSYFCSTCSLIVHKKCISLPHFIKSVWHRHPLSHKYFVLDNECGALDCGICHEEVNKVHGSYYCSDCKFIVHVNCALEDTSSYYKIESIDMFMSCTSEPAFLVIKEIKLGENVMNLEIKHFSHEHNLLLSDDTTYDRYCDGCSLLIDESTSFYQCSQCDDFCLQKSCAEFPRKTEVWLHQSNLISLSLFICSICHYLRSGFAYKVDEDCYLRKHTCLQCFIGYSSYKIPAHKHILLFYLSYNGQCNACGDSTVNRSTYRCKACNFNVHHTCTFLPQIARHKCDEHRLKLTYHEDNDYSEYQYCDICEQRRNPSNWFYHCSICDTSAHCKCVLGEYPFVKLGSIYRRGNHPHPVTLVRMVNYYQNCDKCGKPCLDLALECKEMGCRHIVHWECFLEEEEKEE